MPVLSLWCTHIYQLKEKEKKNVGHATPSQILNIEHKKKCLLQMQVYISSKIQAIISK